MKRVVKTVLALLLLTSAYVAWAGVTDRELIWPVSAVLGQDKEISSTDPDFRDLEVSGDSESAFGGTITIENRTDDYQDVMVTVDIFDGDKNVGELWGTVTLKPRSSSPADLISVDGYASWTDARVQLHRTPS